MKNLIYLAFLSILFSCGEEKKTEAPVKTDTVAEVKAETVKTEPEKKDPVFPHYETIEDMLHVYGGDYNTVENTLEYVSKEPLHIRISEKSADGEPEKRIKWYVKRSIVLIAFRVFAMTDVEKLTITSLPMRINEQVEFVRFMKQYEMTIEVSRAEAMDVMKLYLPIPKTDLKELYNLTDSGTCVEGGDFYGLLNTEVDNVLKEFRKD